MYRYLQFNVGGEKFACDMREVREIIHPPRLIRPAGSPAILDGFADIGGNLVAILRLDRLLEVDYRTPLLYRHILCLKDGLAHIGLLTDRAERMLVVSDADRRPVSGEPSFGAGIAGALETPEGLVHEISLARILSQAERQFVADLVEAEERRRELFQESA